MPVNAAERTTTTDVGLYRVGRGRQAVRVCVKRTYSLVHGRRMMRSQHELPLYLQPVDENADGAEPVDCPVAECDVTPRKLCTDIVVHGHVRSPGAVSVTSTRAAVRIGECWKHVSVTGDRWVTWRPDGTRPSFGTPEPFTELPLTWRRAFGGIDASVPPWAADDDVLQLLSALTPARHLGAYPRNPTGVGWVVNADRRRLDGLRLPNFETPEHPLTPDRLVAGSPDRWPWAPEPAGFGWIGQTWFPRSTLLGLEPGFESLPDHLRRGWLELAPEFDGGPDPRFYSGASSGMRQVGLRGDELVELHGFRHEGPVTTALPGEQPRVTVLFRRQPLKLTTQLNTIELLPDRELATLAWVIEASVPHVLPLNLPEPDADHFDVLEGIDVLLDGIALVR